MSIFTENLVRRGIRQGRSAISYLQDQIASKKFMIDASRREPMYDAAFGALKPKNQL